jgi:hypothetical protein
VIPLAGIEDRVVAVLPPGALMTVTRPPRPKLLRLAGVVQPLNVVICHSFAGARRAKLHSAARRRVLRHDRWARDGRES